MIARSLNASPERQPRVGRGTRLTSMLAAILLAPPAHAQRGAAVPDPDPAIERASFDVADGFEVNLFAADPLLAKPIQLNFDARGRLWVASSEIYPQIKPGQQANDKILILDDHDGDGAADSTTVFADGLLIPTGVAPGDGGAYVANSTELLFLKDTDGDGKADHRQVVLSGFGTEDTHHIIHTFRWGVDGRLYFNQSTYIHSHVETPWGPRRLGGGGIWRFEPASRRLEVFTRGLINPWGHAVDAFGQSFATDGAGGEGINYMIPGASYAWTPGESRIVAGLNPGSPKHCGLEVVSGRHTPDDMQGVLITNDFRAHRVCRFRLADDGAGYASRELPELIKTRHPAFRPVDVVMGPDGAIYVADWYNPIIQHGEVDFRDPRRDHSHGRIWRVTAKGRPPVDRPPIADMNINELMNALKSPEGWTRQFARLRLKELGADTVVPALSAWLAGLDAHHPDVERHRLEGLWVHQALNVPEPTLLRSLVASVDSRVSAAAIRVVPDWRDRISDDDWLALLAERVHDDHPRVRLEAVRALATFGTVDAFEAALRALNHPMDPFLDHALWLTCRELKHAWLPALQAGTLDALADSKALTFAFKAADTPEIVGPLLDALDAARIEPAHRVEIFQVVGAQASPDDLGRALRTLIARGEVVDAEAQALVDGSSGRDVSPAGDISTLVAALRSHDQEPRRRIVLRAAAAWKIDGLTDTLAPLMRSADVTAADRRLIFAALARQGDPPSLDALESVARDAPVDAYLGRFALDALARVSPERAAPHAVALLSTPTATLPTDELASLLAAFSGRKGGPETLAAALVNHTLDRDLARQSLRLLKGLNNKTPLEAALRAAGGLADAAPPPTPEQLQALVNRVSEASDPTKGEALFRRAELQCLNCHAIAGAGGQVGPGLESIGTSAPLDYLVESLLDPNKAVKEGYHSRIVATTDGRVVTGIVRRRDAKEVVLLEADGNEVTLAADQVDEEADGPSLMPRGLVDELTDDEIAHLVRFLSELGKAGGPYAVGPAPLVRRWETIAATPQMAASAWRIGPNALAAGEQPYDAPPVAWTPAYSRADGHLPLADVPPLPAHNNAPPRHWLRFAIEVTQPGPIALQLNATDGLEVWLDGRRVATATLPALDLPPGVHTITLAIDPATRTTPELAIEVAPAPNSTAQARPVTGR